MKSTVEQLNPTRVKINVEVPFDELKPQFDKAYKALAGQVRIPGFRPGKVPARILDARLGRGAVLSEVVNEAVPAKYGEAISEANLSVIGQPEIEVTRIEDGETLEFTAEVDVRPEFTVPDPSTVSVEVADVEVADTDVDEQVEALRDRFATVTEVERAADEGDLVTLDLSAERNGEILADATADGLTYRVGSGDLIDGLDDAVTGLGAGESATFTTALVAGPYAGQEVQVTATVTKVSDRALPEVDEDFAQLASEFDTVAELREDLTEKIRRVKGREQGIEARDKVLEALLATADIPAPESVVKAEVEARQHDAVHSFDHNDEAFAAYLETQGQSREEFDTEVRESAVKAVQTQLLLDALAEQNDVQVDQSEFVERVMFNAQQLGMSPDQYFQRVTQGNQVGAIFADVRRGKALAAAVEQATVTDASGATVDIAKLFGADETATDEAETTPDEAVEVIEVGTTEPADDADAAVDTTK